MATVDIEKRIRAAYQRVTPGRGEWVMLSDIRPLLRDLPRVLVDRALVQMNRCPDVHLVPESNQKALTEEDRAAAVRFGEQDKHLIAID